MITFKFKFLLLLSIKVPLGRLNDNLSRFLKVYAKIVAARGLIRKNR